MKKIDLVLTAIVMVIVIPFLVKLFSGIIFVKMIMGFVTLLVVLYWKLYPYKNQLSPKYLKWFIKIENVMTHIFGIFKNVPKIQLGQNLAMESAPFIICSLLIIFLIVI